MQLSAQDRLERLFQFRMPKSVKLRLQFLRRNALA